MKTAIYKLDDNDTGLPGLARVEVIKPTRLIRVGVTKPRQAIIERQQYKIRVLEIVRRSLIGPTPKVGSVHEVWEGLLEFKA